MRKFTYSLVVGFSLLLLSCGISHKKNERQAAPCPEKFKITEIGIDSISLIDLARNKNALENLFSCYRVEQFLADQDGPTVSAFDIHSDKENKFVLIYMSEDDSSKISRARFFSSKFYDVYGLKLGDKFGDIKRKRGDVKWVTDFDQTTYVYLDGSKIVYVIYGDFRIEDQADPDDITLSEHQIRDWVIERIEWVNRE